MSEFSYALFSQHERQMLDARCREIAQTIEALQEEARVIWARKSALDTLAHVFSETDRQLERARAKQNVTETEMRDMTSSQSETHARVVSHLHENAPTQAPPPPKERNPRPVEVPPLRDSTNNDRHHPYEERRAA